MTRILCLLAIIFVCATTSAQAQEATTTPVYKNNICTVSFNGWGSTISVSGFKECKDYTQSILELSYPFNPNAIYTETGIAKAKIICRDRQRRAIPCETSILNGGAAYP